MRCAALQDVVDASAESLAILATADDAGPVLIDADGDGDSARAFDVRPCEPPRHGSQRAA